MGWLGLTVVLALPLGCDPSGGPVGAAAALPAPLEHDFGAILHGQISRHEFMIDLPGGIAGHVPLGFRTGCSCAGWHFLLQSPGEEPREVDHLPEAYKTAQAGDVMLLRLAIDTGRKEAVDLPRQTLRGSAILRPVDAAPNDASAWREVPILFHYAIEARIDLFPVAHVDVGELPRSKWFEQTLELRPDPDGPPVTFGAPRASDPRVTAHLGTATETDAPVLRVRVQPRPDDAFGPLRAVVEIDTDLPDDYVLRVPVSGSVIEDIVVKPFAHLSFGRIDFTQPAERFVNLTDHDASRPAGFEVVSITNPAGDAMTESFEARCVPIDGDPRGTRLYLRYLGGLTSNSFRGTVRLTKPGGVRPTTDVTFVGFAQAN